MFIPVGDDNPTARVPFVTYGLIAANVVIFAVLNQGGVLSTRIALEWGLVPNKAAPLTFLTSLFLHGDIFHILGNMLFLWISGDNVEDKLGHVWFLVFYLLSGICSCGFYLIFTKLGAGGIPLIGASGAIAGVLGCYMVFFPNARIRIFYWLFIFLAGILRIRAKWFIGFWIGMNVLAWLNADYVTPVAYAAHIGGFGIGVVVAVVAKGRIRGGERTSRADELTGWAPKQKGDPQPVGAGPATPAAGTPPDPAVLRARERPKIQYTSPRVQTERSGQGFFGVEEAIAANVRTGQVDVAVEKYQEYSRMRHVKPLPAWAQIEIASELFRQSQYESALEAYRRYLSDYPDGPDAAEAKFRLGVILSRHRREYFRAREYLLQAAVEHGDPALVTFAREELKRIEPFL